MDDYATRTETLGLADKSEVKDTTALPGVVFIDVRTEQELKDCGTIDRPFIHAPCTTQECPILSANAETMIPDPEVPIVVFCRSGRRAVKAKEVLNEKGYNKVINAGGLEDLKESL
mmetsp:Transcript_4851/g.6639  ORF Transcript_4851/g.6639 Transcript_4851/m.6639 type:complete len:116 (-) Transcript_4851:224-571(-)